MGIARLYGKSAVSFENCEFNQWNASLPAIYAEAGIVKVIGSNFNQANAATHIYLKEGTEKELLSAIHLMERCQLIMMLVSNTQRLLICNDYSALLSRWQ